MSDSAPPPPPPSSGPPEPSWCSYLLRSADYCRRPSVVVVLTEAGDVPVAACPDHVWQIVRWWSGGEERGRRTAQGDRPVVVWPTWLWLADRAND